MFALLCAGLCFLWNPLVNVIDLLPDCVGWLLLAAGLTRFSYLREEISDIRKKAWILCLISVCKLLPMYWSVRGASVYPLAAEPTMVLTYAGCFGLAELFLGLPVLRAVINAFASLGLRYDSPASGRRVGHLRRLTVWFFLIRTANSILPELVYLRSTEYLGNVVYGVVIDIRDYRPYLIIFFGTIAGIVGLCWLTAFLRYLSGIRKDDTFRAGLCAEEEEQREEIVRLSTLERFRTSFGMLFLGSVFFCYLSFEKINVLPDAVGVLLVLIGVFLLRRHIPVPGAFRAGGIIALLVTLPYGVLRTVSSISTPVSWSYRVSDYLSGNIEITAEKTEQLRQQYLLLGASCAETLVLILFFGLLLSALRGLDSLTFADGVTLYDSMTADMRENEKRAYARKPKICFAFFVLSALMEPLQTCPMFAFLVTPVFLVRLFLNLLFLAVFDGYLLALFRTAEYHYSYNMPKNA